MHCESVGVAQKNIWNIAKVKGFLRTIISIFYASKGRMYQRLFIKCTLRHVSLGFRPLEHSFHWLLKMVQASHVVVTVVYCLKINKHQVKYMVRPCQIFLRPWPPTSADQFFGQGKAVGRVVGYRVGWSYFVYRSRCVNSRVHCVMSQPLCKFSIRWKMM